MNQLIKAPGNKSAAKPSIAKRSITKQPSKRKTRAELDAEGRVRKQKKKHRGHPAGARTHVEQLVKNRSDSGAAVIDPRLGSKTPVVLIVDETKVDEIKKVVKPAEKMAAKAKAKLSPEKELELLETDARLDALLERLEDDETLTAAEQKYVDATLDRIDELMVLLGIELDSDDQKLDDELEPKRDDILKLLKQKP